MWGRGSILGDKSGFGIEAHSTEQRIKLKENTTTREANATRDGVRQKVRD